ncbi:hypothetical protein [Flavobacterium cerinum]|uniref:Nucleotide-diphospho-sugar transferase domain-containing protein n=1 Tax=Flavobacterium cerinum TaxID=2502784 RepID=A0ABY5IW36_9FLAO|nr:hypothetical protein [Flavobacterium cerinum]UUC47038.1 hypothetical protein NOX80_07505 [Flavobacterium cerinum]
MVDKNKIAIVTTVASFKLYTKTATLFPEGITKIVIDGTQGMYGIESIHYMFRKLKNKGVEWIIMADEDIFFYDSELIFELIEHMKSNDLDICGVRDGGMIGHRNNNPEAINTFFSVLNFKKIAEKYNQKEIMTYQRYYPDLYQSKDYTALPYNYDVASLKEPYYCFYFWAHHKGYQFLYLDTINPVGDDTVGNIILMPDGRKIAFHSWYARAYEVFEDQTLRIGGFLKDFKINDITVDWTMITVLKDNLHNWKKRFRKVIKKLIKAS